MKRYSVALVRERLAEALDEAERGGHVIIERKGVRYRVTREDAPARRRTSARRPVIETVDKAVAEGQWTWDTTARGARFRGRKP